MASLRAALDREAERTQFSGAVRVDRGGTIEVLTAYGFADRAHGVAMTTGHQLGSASVTKGFTALTIPQHHLRPRDERLLVADLPQ